MYLCRSSTVGGRQQGMVQLHTAWWCWTPVCHPEPVQTLLELRRGFAAQGTICPKSLHAGFAFTFLEAGEKQKGASKKPCSGPVCYTFIALVELHLLQQFLELYRAAAGTGEASWETFVCCSGEGVRKGHNRSQVNSWGLHESDSSEGRRKKLALSFFYLFFFLNFFNPIWYITSISYCGLHHPL